ncbi:hypothetical protein CRUP_017488 [Coryphaenoides rupestris]|nr:hypothetical protein CRUP_017488 [Coryphaenoides rupestris]
MPATWSLARITMVTVSELGRMRLPPSVWARPTRRLSLSSGTLSSRISTSTTEFINHRLLLANKMHLELTHHSLSRAPEPARGSSVSGHIYHLLPRGGSFGLMAVVYSTSEADLVGVAQAAGQDLLMYYDPPLPGALASPTGGGREFNISDASSSRDPLDACAAACLREPSCQAFSLTTGLPVPSCSWTTSWTGVGGVHAVTPPAEAAAYGRNATALEVLRGGRAVPGSDYTPVTAHTGFLLDGRATASLSVPILTDKLPEMDESFAIEILRTVAERNRPSIGRPSRAVVTIAMNGDSFGVFLIYSLSPDATEDGLHLEVTEEAAMTVPLVIERRGGSMGRVTVEWAVVGGGATPGEDFIASGGTLVFADGMQAKQYDGGGWWTAPLVRSITHEMVEPSSLVWEEQEEEEEEDIEEDGEEGEVEKGEVEEGGGVGG